MYEKPRVSQLAIRKSPSMPMLDIAIIDVETKCPISSGRCKTPGTPGLWHYNRKVKSAISLCVGILLCTVVLVALDPSKVTEEPWRGGPRMPRVTLPRWSSRRLPAPAAADQNFEPALEGMGMLFRRGTRAMPHLVVAHLAESTTAEELRLFLRALHRSGMPSHADVVLLFPFRPVTRTLLDVVHEEESYFQKSLLAKSLEDAPAAQHEPQLSVFDSGAYTRAPPPVAEFGARQDSIWGPRRHNNTGGVWIVSRAPALQPAWEVVEPHYGAVVGFDVQELDADDALSGFLHAPPIHLRRWLCYQMLLGMVRHKYRHALVTEVTGVVILTDALLASLKKKDSSQLHLFATTQKWSDPNGTNSVEGVYGAGVWNSLDAEEKRKQVISTGLIVGGVRPVRSVAAAMATEIVRVAMLRKSRECFPDSSLLSYLVHRSSALGRKVASHLQVHSDSGLAFTVNSRSHSSLPDLLNHRNESRFAVIQGLNLNEEILESLQRNICQSVQSDLQIYTDCHRTFESTN